MKLEEKILNKLAELENNIKVYEAFVNASSTAEDDKKIAAFKLFYDLTSLSALSEMIEEYEPSAQIKFQLAVAFKGITGYVQVVDGKVQISPEYKELLKMKDEFLKNQRN